ncbi:MAG: 1-deoxy-D-xylulose-5-phosphate synthase [Candidatus Omnitrophica bacterium]|nr:1-deoxy-D-xylulose-5-phosphate synthase [Candidatus Omnitrophota bacterium]
MRDSFIKTLIDLAHKDKRIVLLTADLGYTVLESFRDVFPGRFFNVGVAEQNMVGVATGMAMQGLIPFVYSIGNFAAFRPFEFIRNGPAGHGLPVRIIGVGAGVDYGTAGKSHWTLEDVGVLRNLLGLHIVVPADLFQAQSALKKTWDLPGPVYYRIGKGDKSALIPEGSFDLGRINVLARGEDVLFVSMGSAVKEVVNAVELLRKDGISCGVAAVSSFNPFPNADLVRVMGKVRWVVTVEDHVVNTGLGGAVAQAMVCGLSKARLLSLGVTSADLPKSGSKKYLYEQMGLSSNKIASAVRQILNRERG